MMQPLKMATIALGLLAGLAFKVSAAEYWPKWRGPEGTGVAAQGNPPTTWSETQNVKWKVPVPGQGTSSPIIWGHKLFFLTAIDTGQKDTTAPTPASAQEDTGGRRGRPGQGRAPSTIHRFDLVCLDRATGKLLWQKTAAETVPHEGHHPDHGFASYSPVTDGKLIWASFGSRGLYCFDLDGKLKWSRDLIEMKTAAGFGEGSSPALAGDAVIVVCDHEGDSAIFAFNKETGQPLWRQDRDEGTSWATPAPVELGGKVQVVTSATNFVRSYDAHTGQVIWQCSGQTRNVIPSPVLGFGKVFCTSGFRGSALLAIELGHTGDLTDSQAVAWQVNEGTPYVPSPLLYGDGIYVCSGNNPILSRYDAQTGKAHFVQQNLSDISDIKGVYASPVGAAGRVYVVGRNGVTVVIKDSETLDVLATNTLDDGFDASPAIVGDEIYLKGRTSLYCIAEAG